MKNLYILAPNIKSGGGKELLMYLIEYIEENHSDINLTVYIDASIENIQPLKNRKVVHLTSNIQKIILFSKKIEHALYFGNLPPLRKTRNTMVYFHNPYLLMEFKKLSKASIIFFIKYFLQQLYIFYFIKNVDSVACQNNKIQKEFIKKYNYNKVDVLPFFRLCNETQCKNSELSIKYDFCYVSLAHPHKNHSLLLSAMKILSEKNIPLSLALTIEKDKKYLLEEIAEINKNGVITIDNLGVLPKNKVCTLYMKSKCLIFPSKEETFGLPLIESVEMGLDVIAADLDYVYQAITPSLVFDPDDANMLAEKIEEYKLGNVKKSKSIIKNKIALLINKII